MLDRPQYVTLVVMLVWFAFLPRTATAQGLAGSFGPPGGTVPFDNSRLNITMLSRDAENDLSPLQSPSLSVSKLDYKAPGKARREYDKGLQLFNRKSYQDAVGHLSAAILMYPDFVAAHNALGVAYLSLNQNNQARDEFAKAVLLDDHLPVSHLNLGCAELALKHYASAEESVQKAASIVPLDLQVLEALAYAQLMNHDYAATIATAHQVHSRKHKGAAIVHYYAAAALDSQSNLLEAQGELQNLLREDPKSSAAEQARGILEQIKQEQMQGKVTQTQTTQPSTAIDAGTTTFGAPDPAALAAQAQKILQDIKEKQQIAEADAMCPDCETAGSHDQTLAGIPMSASPRSERVRKSDVGWTLRSSVDEVAVLFAATDHGNSVLNLAQADVNIRDDSKTPVAVTGFLSESKLPLRLGIVIDTSDSIISRFSFEQKAATSFLQKVLTDKDDKAFVVGFSNSVLMVQDFTGDQNLLSRGVGQLAPVGGTALWDAIAFAADKLAARQEAQPVARVLVVISDGDDNSSSTTLKQAIEAAEHGEVFIYAVSTRDNRDIVTTFNKAPYAVVGDRGLKTLAEGTGGAAFFPGSVGGLSHSLVDLQQVIRSRYLVSYKPALLMPNGQYHRVDITAQKSGRKLRVYARKGYYARVGSASEGTF